MIKLNGLMELWGTALTGSCADKQLSVCAALAWSVCQATGDRHTDTTWVSIYTCLIFKRYCFTSYMQWMQVILLYSCTWHLSHIQTDTVKALIFGKTFMESILFLAKQFAFEEPSVESISGENILIWPHVFW
ncbi:hypothetical protein OIU79_018807 [Salix purpurea]|uniref:Uncharacterized protein n=1 Tax=Salix purpurea TaxID=77065 RepID=A0A9Q0P019_SALPP|nr:hypothetical protein OIU79_018807 [Salix purpurea]